MIIPNRRLTSYELEEWIVGYYAHGGANRFELELLHLINVERENAGVAPLVVNPRLMLATRFKAQSMYDLEYFSLVHPVYGLVSRIARELFNVNVLSAAYHFSQWDPTPQEVMDIWMRSPSQRRNILNPHYTETGVGAINAGTGLGSFGNIWVQIFADTEEGIVHPPNIPQSEITIPNRRLTPEELSQWIAEYHAMDGANIFELEVLRLVNLERANAGLAPLSLNPTLMMSARFKSQSMSDLNYFSHTNPVYGHFTNIPRELFNIMVNGENIALWHRTPEAVMLAWMNSPGHRANILNPQFTELGVGFFRDRWTQKFGTGTG